MIGWFASNHVSANIMLLFFVAGGIIALFAMRTATFPSVDPRLITVTVPYPGATTFEVEDAITSRIEEAVTGLEGIKKITSVAAENVGSVTIELEEFVDANETLNDVENEVSQLVDFPPDAAEQPRIVRVKPQPQVMTLVLHGDASPLLLKRWAERIEEDLLQLEHVGLVEQLGSRDYEISIEIDETTLRRYGLTLADVGRRIRAFSRNLPAGTIESDSGDILLRIQEKGEHGASFEDIVIESLPDGSLLRLSDIATIRDGLADTNLVSRYQGENAVLLRISRSESQDTLSISTAVRDYLHQLQLPEGLTIEVMDSQTDILRDRMSLLGRNAVLGYALVFFILLLFLDLKLAFWTSLGIPVSFLGGILLVYMGGFSINMITLFAFIVVLGIVVDDAIVTGESIFTEQERGKKGVASAVSGVRAIIAPVTIGVLTTMTAFAPLAFSTGTLGQILRDIPVVVISVLAVSLFEAFLILPAHLSSAKRWSIGPVASARRQVDRFLGRFTETWLLPAVRFVLGWRYVSLTVFIAILWIAVSLFRGDLMRFVFFPVIEGDEVNISLVMPVGTPFETVQAHVDDIQRAIEGVESKIESENESELIEGVLVMIGATLGEMDPTESGGTKLASNKADLRILLSDADKRTFPAGKISRLVQEAVGEIPGAEELTFESSLVQGGKDVSIRVSHPDEDELDVISETLKREMRRMDGVTEVTDSLKVGKNEYVFELTAAGLAAGLSPASLGAQLRHAVYGFEVQRIQRDRAELKVMVRYPERLRDSLAGLRAMRIRLPGGEEAPLETVATIEEQRSFATIQRIDGIRSATVGADVLASITTPNEVIGVISSDVMPPLEARYPELDWGVEGESKDRRDDLRELARNLGIALLVILVLLGTLLRSYLQPFIILAAIPFAFIGALLGHLLMGFNLSFVSIFGLVALSGVVINDSVVLIDYFNDQRENQPTPKALERAIERRFRPVLLTTMTTSFGLLPMLLETNLQAQFLIPMAISLAFGLLFGTLVIVFLVPTLVMVGHDVTSGVRSLLSR